MPPKRKSKKDKAKVILDLSEEVSITNTTEEFEVKNYDYKDLQQPDDPFENDLNYLLQDQKQVPTTHIVEEIEILQVESPITNNRATPKSRKRNNKKIEVKIDDITKDMEEITFSSSDEDNDEPSETSKKAGTKSSVDKKKKANQKRSERRANARERERESERNSKSGTNSPVKSSEQNNSLKSALTNDGDEKFSMTSLFNKEVLDDLNRGVSSDCSTSMNESPVKAKQKKKKRNNKKKSPAIEEPEQQLNGKIEETVQDVTSPLKSNTPVKNTPKKTKKNKDVKDVKVTEQSSSPSSSDVASTKKSRKNKSSKKSNSELITPQREISPSNDSILDDENETLLTSPENVVTVKEDKASGIEYIDDGQPIVTQSDSTVLVGKDNELITVEELKKKKTIDKEYSIYDHESSLSRNERMKLNAKKSPENLENPFAINLRSTKRTISNGKYSENLPRVNAIKTIIGLSHKQILNLPLTDVKCKAIISSTMTTKFVANILKFSLLHSHDIFSDVDIRSKFLQVCVSVALYESTGFKKTMKEFPVDVLFGHYPEITLENTGTKLTPPSETIHQNQFDYSVLSFIGHVVIWAYAQQVEQNVVPLLAEKYPNLNLSVKEVQKNLGGDHLWDRLRRDAGTINTKRWKHINKFRENFGFYEDQFMLILRFLNVDDTIP